MLHSACALRHFFGTCTLLVDWHCTSSRTGLTAMLLARPMLRPACHDYTCCCMCLWLCPGNVRPPQASVCPHAVHVRGLSRPVRDREVISAPSHLTYHFDCCGCLGPSHVAILSSSGDQRPPRHHRPWPLLPTRRCTFRLSERLCDALRVNRVDADTI
jgi:hypothetical protein